MNRPGRNPAIIPATGSHPRRRILIIAPTLGHFGGIEAFSVTMAHQLIASGHCEIRLVFRLRKIGRLDPSLETWLASQPFETKILKGPSLRVLRHLCWADLVNCHFPLIDVAIPARLLGKPLYLSVENRRQAEHTLLHRIGLKLALRRWYISRFVAHSWEGPTLSPKSFIVPAISDLPNTYVSPADRKGFIFIARWIPKKGLEELVAAFSSAQIDHASHPLTLIGDGPLKNKVVAAIESSPVRKWIHRHGFLSQQEKETLLAQARWNIAPAQFEEDLGLTPIEARNCGIPSIVTNIGGLPEAGGAAALVCAPFSITSLRTAIEDAAAMPAADYEMRCEIAKASLEHYLAKPDFYAEALGLTKRIS